VTSEGYLGALGEVYPPNYPKSAASPDCRYLLPSTSEGLGENSRFPERSHEIGIAVPPWQQVAMQMIGNSGTCGTTQIKSYVLAFRFVRLVNRSTRGTNE
jgi:hypothetical protein